jgi:hypothetical protein
LKGDIGDEIILGFGVEGTFSSSFFDYFSVFSLFLSSVLTFHEGTSSESLLDVSK